MKNKQKCTFQWNSKQTGFTLIELLVTIVIMGILSVISISSYHGFQAKARLAKAQQFAAEADAKLKADTFSQGLNIVADCQLDGIDGDGFSPCLSGFRLAKQGTNIINVNKFANNTPFNQGKSLNNTGNYNNIIKNGITTNFKNGVTIMGWFNNYENQEDEHASVSFYKIENGDGFNVQLNMNKYWGQDSIVTSFDILTQNGGVYMEGPLLSFENKWHYLLGTYDNNTEIAKFYVDGELVAVEDASSVSGDFPVGSFSGGFSVRAATDKIFLDDVKVYPVPMVGVDPRVSSGVRTLANGGDEFDLS